MTDNHCIIRPTPNAQRHNYFLKFLTVIFKMTISVIIAFILLTPIAKFYTDTNWPNATEDIDGATDLRLPPFANYAILSEGFSYGKLNNEGYNNPYNYENGMSVDVLIMGSSQMFARQVIQKNNTASILMDISEKKVYNIGMISHFFLTCADNLKAALKKYKPKYVVIETIYVSFSDREILEVLSSNVPQVTSNGSLGENVGMLRSMYRKYIRELLQNISKKFIGVFFVKENVFGAIQFYIENFLMEKQIRPNLPSNPNLLSQVLKRMADTVKASDAKLIIVYDPSIALNKDGSLKILENPEAVKVFADACEQNGIYFVDLSERFLSEYEKNYTLPYGFFNTSVASGHMNKDGHRMFAEEIYKLMQKIEGVNN